MTLLTRSLAAFLALAGAVALSACASSSYMGISLKPGSADPALQLLAQRARAGDREAKLKLARRLEAGNGIARNAVRAQILYAEVAVAVGGRWQPPSGRRSTPILVGGSHDHLGNTAEANLRLLAAQPMLEMHRVTVKGIFDRVNLDDAAGIASAEKACEGITGEFAAMIEPRPQSACIATALRRRGSTRVYAIVHYSDATSNASAARDAVGDYYHAAALELWPIPNTGDCGTFNAVELIKERVVVATILVSAARGRKIDCHSKSYIHDPNVIRSNQ